jgi:hypothetical protein
VLLNPKLEAAGWWTADVGPRKVGPVLVHHSILVKHCQDWIREVMASVEIITNAKPRSRAWLNVTMEDVGAGVINPKPAMRQSGAILGVLNDYALTPLLVLPIVWQKHLGFVRAEGGGRGAKTSSARKAFSKAWALERGFDPKSDDGVKLTHKQIEDLCDAYCLAQYGVLRGAAKLEAPPIASVGSSAHP